LHVVLADKVAQLDDAAPWGCLLLSLFSRGGGCRAGLCLPSGIRARRTGWQLA
jgi:hypothetical protein